MVGSPRSDGTMGISGATREVVRPIVRSCAFGRLRGITFLGILSPTYKQVPDFPLAYNRSTMFASDRTRAHHSIAVASLAMQVSLDLGISEAAVGYAVAWGLLHDVATWPLSHTGEAAFSDSTNTNAGVLRRMMILGSDCLTPSLSLHVPLKEAGIDHETLLALFDKRQSGFDQDLAIVHNLIHSALTPDTLEGMYRSGVVLGVEVPHPKLFVRGFERDLVADVRLKQDHSGVAFKFWRSKSRIYADHINNPRTVAFESKWSRTIQNRFGRLGLNESLALSEAEIVHRVTDTVTANPSDLLRYKPPSKYLISTDHRQNRTFHGAMSVKDLSRIFIRNEM